MTYCKTCGTEKDLNATSCPVCGEKYLITEDKGIKIEKTKIISSNIVDEPNILLNILSFIFPVIGIIFLAFVWKGDRTTKRFESLLFWTAIRIIINTIIPLATFVLLFPILMVVNVF